MKDRVVLQDRSTGLWLHFTRPLAIITSDCVEDVLPALREVETAVQARGLYAAGFVTYEAAPAFDPAFRVRTPSPLPLLWFGLYRKPVTEKRLSPALAGYNLGKWRPTIYRHVYDKAIAQIKRLIAAGETYQVNYTFRMRTSFQGDPWSLFTNLARAQQASCAAYVDTGAYVICSVSPELFFTLNGRFLNCRPMKGTAARGPTLAEDRLQMACLQHSEKNRAENLMIVDMVRNDMGRIAALGSVKVPEMFSVERYPTVLQMTSTVTAETEAPITDIIAALFPPASVTGAPKVHTTQIIAQLETEPRNIYTGAIGFIAPQRRAQFNVAIRTVRIDLNASQAEYGVGGGIVWDSNSTTEYSECRIKARVLTAMPSFEPLETLLWQPKEGYFLLARHLQRLADSANYFGIPFSADLAAHHLETCGATFSEWSHKVRLLLAQDGEITTEAQSLPDDTGEQPLRLRLAPTPVDMADPFLYHKTTNRRVYDVARAASPNCDDVLLWNHQGEITEATTANVVVKLDGELVTPPVQCGLLPGTFRAELLSQGIIRERVIPVSAIRPATDLYLINSVRRWCQAFIEPPAKAVDPSRRRKRGFRQRNP